MCRPFASSALPHTASTRPAGRIQVLDRAVLRRTAHLHPLVSPEGHDQNGRCAPSRPCPEQRPEGSYPGAPAQSDHDHFEGERAVPESLAGRSPTVMWRGSRSGMQTWYRGQVDSTARARESAEARNGFQRSNRGNVRCPSLGSGWRGRRKRFTQEPPWQSGSVACAPYTRDRRHCRGGQRTSG